MSLKSELRVVETAIASWRLPPEPPLEELRETAAEYSLPLDTVIAIWRRISAASPNGFIGAALMCYIWDLEEARDEYAARSQNEE